MSKLKVNLHCHTAVSDGIFKMQEIIEMAEGEQIDVLAVTDHNFVHADICEYQLKHPNIKLICGCELSTAYKTKNGKLVQVHIVCLGLKSEDEAFFEMLKSNRKDDREAYINAIKKKLWENCNIFIPDYKALKDIYDKSHISRMEINDYLVKQGYAKDIDEAFDKYTGTYGERRAYVDELLYENYIPMKDALKLINDSGAKAVLAHLYSYHLPEDECEDLIKCFAENGGHAMEVYYLNGYSPEQIEKLNKYSEKYHLLQSTGDDFHGRDPKKPLTGEWVDDEMYKRHIISEL